MAPSRATREDKRRQGLGKADTQSNTCGKTMGGKGRQDFGKVDTIQQRHIRGETMGDQRGDKGRQGLGKADTPSNTGPGLEANMSVSIQLIPNYVECRGVNTDCNIPEL